MLRAVHTVRYRPESANALCKHVAAKSKSDCAVPLSAALKSVLRHQTRHWSKEEWHTASTTLLQSVRTKTGTLAELVHLLAFWAKALTQEPQEITNPEGNVTCPELLTAVLTEICQHFDAEDVNDPHLLRSLCNSCLHLQIELPLPLANYLTDTLAHSELELPTVVDILCAVCSLTPGRARKLGAVEMVLLSALTKNGELRDHVARKLMVHVAPSIPTNRRPLHSLLLWECMHSAHVRHALPRYLLYLHLCGGVSHMLLSLPVRVLRNLHRHLMVAREPACVGQGSGSPARASLQSLANKAIPRSSTLEKDVVRALRAMLRRGHLTSEPVSLQLQCRVSTFFILDAALTRKTEEESSGM